MCFANIMIILYLIVGTFQDNLILRLLKGDISRHSFFVILENLSKPIT